MTERENGDHEQELRGDDVPGAEEDENAPVAELTVIQADDALLDALGGPDPQVADELGDQELNALLLAWRREIDSEPIGELVDAESAAATIQTAVLAQRDGGRGRRRRMLVPVAAAAAVLAIGFTGTAVAARDAQPGDALWGLSKVLYSEHAQSVEAAAAVRTDLQEAQLALAQRRFDDARLALRQAERALPQVNEGEAAQLKAQHTQLVAQLNQPGGEDQQNPPPAQVSDTTTSTPDTSVTEAPVTPTDSQESSSQSPDTSTSPTTDSPSPTTSAPSSTTDPESDGGPRVGSVSGAGTEPTP